MTPRFKSFGLCVVAGALIFGPPRGATPSSERFRFLQQESFRSVPVVMIVFDELPVASLMDRSGVIDDRMFPNFARVQKDSIWFRNTTTARAFTEEALPALLTGKYPKEHQPDNAHIYPRSLFTLLGGAYDIRSVQELPGLCTFTGCDAVTGTAGSGLWQRKFGFFPRGGRGSKFAEFFNIVERSRGPRFYFLHLIMPHYPWRYLPSGQRYLERDPVPGEVDLPGRGRGWGADPWLVRQAYQRHLLQTRLVDRLLGVLVKRLTRAGLYEPSLLIVTADHGISFLPSNAKRWIREETAGGVAPIPLFLKKPFQERGRVSDAPVDLVDVVPTIADVLHLSRVWRDLEGTSALNGSIGRGRVRGIPGQRFDPRGREKYEVVEKKYRRFVVRKGSIDLFHMGPGASGALVGRRVEDLTIAAPARATAHVRHHAAHENLDPDADVVPALLEGSLRRTSEGSRAVVAAAVNGRIAAVTRTYVERGSVRFYFMLPPRLFHERRNDVDLFLVDDVQPGTLAPVGEN